MERWYIALEERLKIGLCGVAALKDNANLVGTATVRGPFRGSCQDVA